MDPNYQHSPSPGQMLLERERERREIPDHKNNHIGGVYWSGVGGSVSLLHASTDAPLETVLIGS